MMKYLFKIFLTSLLLFSSTSAGWKWNTTKLVGKAGMVYGAKKGLDLYKKSQLKNKGRQGKQKRLRELINNDKVASSDKGWIKQEINKIKSKKRGSIRNPIGKDMAHERGREASKGYGYEHSNLQDKVLHNLQHKYDNFGKKNKERPIKD